MNTGTASFLDQTVGGFLDEIASETPAPGGGSVAAIVVAMAAGLVAMAARFSFERWPEAAGVAEQADEIRERVSPLAQADAQAFEEVLTAMRLPKQLEPEVRSTTIRHALGRAADIPLLIAEEARDVAELAAAVSEHGNPNLRGDATAAAFLAHAGARVAANLVAVNVGSNEDDDRVERAHAHVAATEAASARASAATR